MKDVIKIGLVNFTSEWGNKEVNLKRIEEYCEIAGNEDVNMIVFPETALSGYDNEARKEKKLKMHTRVAETILGKSTERNEWTGNRDWRPDLYGKLFAKSQKAYDKMNCEYME